MKKKLTIAGLSVLGLAAAYFGGIGYYAERFTPNTEFMAVNVGNLTLDEAKKRISEEISNDEYILLEDGKEVAKVKIADLDPVYNTDKQLTKMYYSQNPNYWLANLVTNTVSAEEESENESLIELNTSEITEEINASGEREPAQDASINYDEEKGYHSVEGEAGTVVDPELLEQKIIDQIDEKDNQINLEETYDQPGITMEDSTIKETMEEIENTIHSDLTIEISGDKVNLDPKQIEGWLHFDENNQMVLVQEQVADYLRILDEKYSTYGKTRQFDSTLQGTVEVPPGILGWGIDIETATEELSQAILNQESGAHQLATVSSGGNAGAEDEIGGTYVEIDLSHQQMFLYVDDELILQTEIVSGQPGAETVPGANAVNEMLHQTNLVGYNQFANVQYSTPVDYWIRFDDQAQGIHDASWQGTFGGDTHLYAGSLGCINTPHGAVSTIYEYVEIGTPVMVFY
ncbi:L,D-transpeptidase/peptidoglycan binding protein [Aerococcaceae bacterium DSM 111020]|nr:L,D-transpeptidase/peptidoglycan binding protein [Aerococcaceae bacterium DSM 111020]